MNYAKELNNPIFKIIQSVSDELKYETYAVGGWVRDLLLNRSQEKTDIDFVCVGSGIKLMEDKVYLDLGRLYRDTGDSEKAKSSFQWVVDKGTEAEFKKMARLYLDELN